MFQLLRAVSALDLFRRQLPCFTLAFVVAAVFYRFGSFALECVGFLATWFVLDAIYDRIGRMVGLSQSGLPRRGAGQEAR